MVMDKARLEFIKSIEVYNNYEYLRVEDVEEVWINGVLFYSFTHMEHSSSIPECVMIVASKIDKITFK